MSDPQARRVENRVVGMDANPYLAMAAVLACGYLGMVQQISARDSIETEAYELPRSLPVGVVESLDLFENNELIRDLLGQTFSSVYIAIKREEYKEFLRVISPWEREHLLLNV